MGRPLVTLASFVGCAVSRFRVKKKSLLAGVRANQFPAARRIVCEPADELKQRRVYGEVSR
jgi:hypothetical protein